MYSGRMRPSSLEQARAFLDARRIAVVGVSRNEKDFSRMVLRELARHVANVGGPGSHAYRDRLADFFGSLDFEADLDYSPLDDAPAPREPPRTPAGLILPFSPGRER